MRTRLGESCDDGGAHRPGLGTQRSFVISKEQRDREESNPYEAPRSSLPITDHTESSAVGVVTARILYSSEHINESLERYYQQLSWVRLCRKILLESGLRAATLLAISDNNYAQSCPSYCTVSATDDLSRAVRKLAALHGLQNQQANWLQWCVLAE